MRCFVIIFLLLKIIAIDGRSTNKAEDIIVIGAGLAGFSATAKLLENGFDNIIVLEAEDRIGGRVHSIPHGKGSIDLGAQWCHGEKDNAIFELVDKHFHFGRSDELEDHVEYLISSGENNQEDCAKLEEILSTIFERSDDARNISVGNFVKQEYEKIINSPEYQQIDTKLASLVITSYGKQITAFYAADSWFNVSAHYDMYTQECKGNQLLTWRDEGFKTVFEYLAKRLPNPSEGLDVESKVQFKKEVTNIKWNESGKVQVTCKDGSIYFADHVIFTSSLGVLKDRHETLFTPKLPERKVKAIEGLGFGAIGKVYLEFEKPFWLQNSSDFSRYIFLWQDDDLKEIQDSDKSWLENLIGFNIIDGFPNILEGFISGDDLKTFETLSDEKVISDCLWLLKKFLHVDLPNLTSMTRTKWFTNRNFLGSYSYLSMKTEREEVNPKDLAKPLYDSDSKPLILFAGEATHEKYSSYSHGAVESGWRAADELLKYFDNKNDKLVV